MEKLTVDGAIDALVEVLEAGKLNSEQAQLIRELRVRQGRGTSACTHQYDSYCDASNVFHCMGCNAVVPAPQAEVNTIR